MDLSGRSTFLVNPETVSERCITFSEVFRSSNGQIGHVSTYVLKRKGENAQVHISKFKE
jgi:hypothetical protein